MNFRLVAVPCSLPMCREIVNVRVERAEQAMFCSYQCANHWYRLNHKDRGDGY